ncbi:type-F conjugative transfer system pilin assembly protein TrbC [Pseudorhodoferax soli]|nr:type-F conjugative transfer system pilin assembly protein TrbC [Pseudorhodoferax soli]
MATEQTAPSVGANTRPWPIALFVAAALLSASALAWPQTTLAGASTSGPRIDALPQPLVKPSFDLEAIARGYASQSQEHSSPPAQQRGPGLIIFVSLAMPRLTLERLLDQATRAGASVVLRGFAEGSLRKTVTQLQELIGNRPVGVQVDPPAFDRFAITRVPSFVLVRDGTRPKPCEEGSCAPPEDFLQVAGDVSLDYALTHMQRSSPSFKAETTVFLDRLRP